MVGSGTRSMATRSDMPLRISHDPRREGVVVHPSAGSEGGGDDGWVGDQIHGNKVGHALTNLPAINIGSVEERLVSLVEFRVRGGRGRHKTNLLANLEVDCSSGDDCLLGSGGSPQGGQPGNGSQSYAQHSS